ncbi:endonuclease-phosphatase domain-containing protein [Haloferula helveola]|uniref:Endonuclease-phosphatase domain-containing protein n=2 Tax=Haloferula helveola TaxID=490095 RepID=A0ABM7RJP3_9BACT|nr:endonuclease-phosphatase domain-containing protein [Haloferula helveola]
MGAEPAEVAATDLRVMSYNVMWEENGVRAGNKTLPVWQERRKLVRDILRRHQPDVVGLQETSPEQQVGLAEDNPGYGILYDRKLNNTNPILYRADRFNVSSSGAFVLNDRPEKPDTNIGVRKASFARLVDRRTGQPFTVFNIHLDGRGDGSTRRISAVRLAERMAAERNPVILTGDFNCRRTSPTLQFFLGEKALPNDTGESSKSPRPLRDSLLTTDPDHKLIDFVMVDPDFKVRSAVQLRDVDRKASDHFPVLAVVSLGKAEEEDTRSEP